MKKKTNKKQQNIIILFSLMTLEKNKIKRKLNIPNLHVHKDVSEIIYM